MTQVVALYIRLSSEDSDLNLNEKTESQSITNQRNLLMDYVETSSEFQKAEIVEFCDDGWSGKNFDRPAIKHLVNAARSGAIHCVIVKDFSRFGRDYIVVGNYVSRVFPFLGVRFISVNDHFDSSRPNDIDRLDLSFKMLMNDMYSRDLSKKVSSAKKGLWNEASTSTLLHPLAIKKTHTISTT